MEIRLLDSKEHKNVYLFKKVDINLCNAIRRTIISRVPTLAIEDVEIYENGSAHYDETVAHRLGLVPLVTDTDVYNEIRVSEDIGSAKNEVEFSLNVTGPCTVYSKDIEFKDPGVKPVSDEDPITVLAEGKTLKITGKASVNNGAEHAKWAPGHVFYSYKPEWKNPKAHDRDCPLHGKKIDVEETVIAKNEDIVFTVESWGGVEANKLLELALDNINNQCEAILNAISASESGE